MIDHRDALPLDNVAYAAIRPDRQVNVLLVTAGNMALEKALQTQRIDRLAEVRVEAPSFLGAEEYGLAAAEGRFDLIIYDGCTPSKMPAASTLFIGGLPPQDIQPIPPPGTNPSPATNPIPAGNGSAPAATLNEEEKWQFGPPSGPVIILDVNRSHPISQYVEMASVSIVESRTVKPPSSGSILMISDVGPVFGIAPRGPFQDAVLGFDIVRPTENGTEMNSDWGIKRSFPVFVFSAVEQLAGGVTQAGAATVQPGQAMPLVLSNRFKNYKIVNPIGKTESIERGSDGRFLYTRTEEPGVYEIFAEGLNEPVDRFCVNLFSERESNLAVGLELKTSSEAIPATDAKIRARQETWRWLLLLALGLLMLEWVVFNKRIFV